MKRFEEYEIFVFKANKIIENLYLGDIDDAKSDFSKYQIKSGKILKLN